MAVWLFVVLVADSEARGVLVGLRGVGGTGVVVEGALSGGALAVVCLGHVHKVLHQVLVRDLLHLLLLSHEAHRAGNALVVSVVAHGTCVVGRRHRRAGVLRVAHLEAFLAALALLEPVHLVHMVLVGLTSGVAVLVVGRLVRGHQVLPVVALGLHAACLLGIIFLEVRIRPALSIILM